MARRCRVLPTGFLSGGEIDRGGFPRIFCSAEKEAGAIELNVGQEKSHRAALGDFPGFVQVAMRALGAGPRASEKPQPGAGEEAVNEVPIDTGAAGAFDGSVKFARVRKVVQN